MTDSPDSTAKPERAKPRDSGDVMWEEVAEASGKAGPEVIADFVKHLPKKPGVYRMLNDAGDVLYVGKARNLKNRVQNYARGVGHGGNRTARMIAETAHMEFVVTHTETEALLLEANLIKRLRPRFNVLMRDDKSFPYILLTAITKRPACSNTVARGLEKARFSDRLRRPAR